MKAIKVHEFGLPEVLKLEETPELKPNATQVLVKINAIGVNPVETYIRSGVMPENRTFHTLPGRRGRNSGRGRRRGDQV